MIIQAPNVNERSRIPMRHVPMRRIPMRTIRAVARQIADKFHSDKVILFGSYANGKPNPENSD